MHPLHDILVPESLEDFIPAVIEIPQGSKLKYETGQANRSIDARPRALFLGPLPGQLRLRAAVARDDGDPLDILVLMQEPVVPLTIVRARPIGGFSMTDDKGIDDKIIAVAVDDPAFAALARRSRNAVAHHHGDPAFFEDYKALENKMSVVEGMYRPRPRAGSGARGIGRVPLGERVEQGLNPDGVKRPACADPCPFISAKFPPPCQASRAKKRATRKLS